MTYVVKLRGNGRDEACEGLLPKVASGFNLEIKGHLTVHTGDTVLDLPKFHQLVNNHMQENDTILFYDIVGSVGTYDELMFLIGILKANKLNFVDLTHIEATTKIYTQEFLYNTMIKHVAMVMEYWEVRGALERGEDVETQYVTHVLPNFKTIVYAALGSPRVVHLPAQVLYKYNMENGNTGVRFDGSYGDLKRYIEGKV